MAPDNVNSWGTKIEPTKRSEGAAPKPNP